MSCFPFYPLNRAKMKTGDLISFSGTGLIAKLIQWRTHSIFSHVGMVIVDDRIDGDERVLLLQSTLKTGVVELTLSSVLNNFTGRAFWHPLDHAWATTKNPHYQTDLLRESRRLLGRPYDVQGVIRFVLPFIEEAAMAYFCSETAARCEQAASLWDVNFKSPSKQAPVDTVNLPIFQHAVPL